MGKTRTMLTLLLLAGATGTNWAAPTVAAESPPPPRRSAIEITCGIDGAKVTHDVGEAGPKGVTVRFTHPDGEWRMTWEGALRSSRSDGATGSGMVAEMALPIPPGPARIACIPSSGDYHDPRWWTDAEVQDPRGHWRPTRLDCTTSVGTSWHGGRRPAAEERDMVAEALRWVSAEPQDGDHLGRVGYPRMQPRVWGLYRDDRLIGAVHMMVQAADGSVAPNFMYACSPPSQ